MTNASDDWKVLPHGPLEQISERVWRTEGDLESGPPLKRVMVVAKRANGELVIHNGMALDEASMTKLESLGPVAYVVVPNGFHRMDAGRFAKRYPNAKIVCPSGSKAKVEKITKRVDLVYEDFPEDDHVRLVTLRGIGEAEGVMIVRDGADGKDVTLVTTDMIFNMPHAKGFGGFVLRYLTDSSGGPKVSRLARLFIIKDKQVAADHLRELAAIPGLKRVIVGHHLMIEDHPAATLRSVADQLAS